MLRCAFAALAVAACSGDAGKDDETGTSGDADTDTDTDADADADADSDADTDSDIEPDLSATWSGDVAPIVQAKCRTCHYDPPVAPSGGFEIVDYTSIVNVASSQLPSMPYVTPGDPDQSYLWHKLNDNQVEVGGSMSAMPLSAPLSADELATIEGWILGDCKP